MARVRLWAGFHECLDVDALFGVAAALEEATEEVREVGCEVAIVAEDIGDQQLAITGPKGDVRVLLDAAGCFAERGFEPEIYAESAAELAKIEALDRENPGLLPEGVSIEGGVNR